MNLGNPGSGIVARTLGAGFIKHGHSWSGQAVSPDARFVKAFNSVHPVVHSGFPE